MSKNLGVQAEIFGRIYAQMFAIENPGYNNTSFNYYATKHWCWSKWAVNLTRQEHFFDIRSIFWPS